MRPQAQTRAPSCERASRLFSVVVAAVLGAVIAAGCDGDSGGAPTRTASPSNTRSPTPNLGSSCPNEAAAVADDDLLVGGSLSGDISGDGTDDTTAVHVDDSADVGCRAFLVVTAENGVSSAPVWVLGATGGLSTPTPAALVPIGTEPGLEVIVNEAAGASTQFVGAFTLTSEGLHRIGARGDPVSDVVGLFASGGSVGHLEAVDCLNGGVVVSVATPAAGRAALEQGVYNVERRVFKVAGSVLEPESTRRDRVDIDDLNSRFPEFAHSPFLSCTLL